MDGERGDIEEMDKASWRQRRDKGEIEGWIQRRDRAGMDGQRRNRGEIEQRDRQDGERGEIKDG